MKSRRQADWSFLLMRGAEHSVKQFTVRKRSLVATPVALIAIITSCFIGMKLQAASQIKELELKIEHLSNQYDQANNSYNSTLQQHQSTITSLEYQLEHAYNKQKLIDDKLLELKELEKQLEQFIMTYGSDTPLELDRDMKTNNLSDNLSALPNLTKTSTDTNIDGYMISQLNHNLNSESLNKEHSFSINEANYSSFHDLPIEQLTKVVDNFIEVMHYNLNKAGNIRENVDAYPNFWPAQSKMTTSGYGYRIDPFTKHVNFHAGIDIDGNSGDTIFSAGDGIVVEADYDKSYGYYIVIEHTKQLKTLYGHLKSIDAKKGDTVVKGEKIGKMGTSGRSTGTHLHFQVMLNNQPVSPLKYIIKPKQ